METGQCQKTIMSSSDVNQHNGFFFSNATQEEHRSISEFQQSHWISQFTLFSWFWLEQKVWKVNDNIIKFQQKQNGV